MKLVKAHAYGNDFLLLDSAEIRQSADRPELARKLCARHTGVGADGLIVWSSRSASAAAAPERGFGELAALRAASRMDLLNADGSYSEVSGNGVRCLAAWLARVADARASDAIAIDTDAGTKTLELLERDGPRFLFRAAMGQPENVEKRVLNVDGVDVEAITLRVGNPQCVVLGDVTHERLHSLAAKLAVHPAFPAGSNVELATVEAPDRVRILIWERGVGPTEASGTGACASAVAAMAFGGANRDVQVASPGGTQRVEWTEEGLFLTGWAELIGEVAIF